VCRESVGVHLKKLLENSPHIENNEEELLGGALILVKTVWEMIKRLNLHLKEKHQFWLSLAQLA
jgi:hypothetical protein